MLSYRIQINIFIAVTIVSNLMLEGTKAENSKCTCSEEDIMSMSKIGDMNTHFISNTEQVEIWTKNRDFVEHLRYLWDNGLQGIVETLMKKHGSRIAKPPISESTRPEDDEPVSSIRPKPPVEDDELVKSDVLTKLENAENRTLEVEEELRNEQRILRVLQKEVNETQTSLNSLRKQLHNIIAPVDNVLSNIQRIVSSIESMNRTIYEDHLQKLYDTVDGVVYKNETRKLGERIELIEKEIRGGYNSSIISKLSNDVKNLEGNLQIINISITNNLVPRMMMLESETARKDAVKELEKKVTYLLNITEEFKLDLMWDVRRGRRSADTCGVPVSNDPHLLVDTEMEPDGTRILIFGCHPVGQYAVNSPPTPVRCEGGTWSGSYPTCRALPGASEVKHFYEELMKEYPCTAGTELYQDPTNCSRFFSCSSGVRYCPEQHHFDSNLKKCVFSDGQCNEGWSGLVQELRNLIPHIDIEPNNVDKPGGLLGTGPAGQLIVYPRSNFTLHCLYPEFFRRGPYWEVTYPNLEPGSRSTKPQEHGKNKVGLVVTSAVEEDTGLYRCITPFGKSHGIYVSVKAVHCPPLPINEEYEDVFYTPTPEGHIRILGSTAEFPCMKGKEYAICKADGKWSKGSPECALRKRCKLPDTADNKDLILKEVLNGKYVSFECASGLNLVGDSQMRCLGNGTWSLSSLPVCVK